MLATLKHDNVHANYLRLSSAVIPVADDISRASYDPLIQHESCCIGGEEIMLHDLSPHTWQAQVTRPLELTLRKYT